MGKLKKCPRCNLQFRKKSTFNKHYDKEHSKSANVWKR